MFPKTIWYKPNELSTREETLVHEPSVVKQSETIYPQASFGGSSSSKDPLSQKIVDAIQKTESVEETVCDSVSSEDAAPPVKVKRLARTPTTRQKYKIYHKLSGEKKATNFATFPNYTPKPSPSFESDINRSGSIQIGRMSVSVGSNSIHRSVMKGMKRRASTGTSQPQPILVCPINPQAKFAPYADVIRRRISAPAIPLDRDNQTQKNLHIFGRIIAKNRPSMPLQVQESQNTKKSLKRRWSHYDSLPLQTKRRK